MKTPTWVANLLVQILFVPAWFLIPTQDLLEMLNGAIVALSLGIAIAYRKGIGEVLTKPFLFLMGSDALILAVFQTAVATSAVFTSLFIWRIVEEQDGFTTHWSWAFARWVMCSSLALFLVSSSTVDSRVPPTNYITAGWVVAAGVSVALIVVAVSV